MLSGVKFIPRDQVQKKDNLNAFSKEKDKSNNKSKKHSRRKSSSGINSSDDEVERIKRSSAKKERWYHSDEYSSPYSTESDSETDLYNGKKPKDRKKYKGGNDDTPRDSTGKMSKKRSRTDTKYYSSGEESASTSDCSGDRKVSYRIRSMQNTKLKGKERRGEAMLNEEFSDNVNEKLMKRKEVGLGWMNRPSEETNRPTRAPSEPLAIDQAEEVRKENPRELNPYLQDNGCGYPEEPEHSKTGADKLLSSSVVGDGGASWRLKALKRAQEQAAREGRKFEEVVEERWGSLGHLAVSVASRAVAPSRAHLHAIKNRKKNLLDDHETVANNKNTTHIVKNEGRDYLQDVSLKHPELRAPKVHDSLSWRKRKDVNYSSGNPVIISTALSSLNKFSNDGNFMREFMNRENTDSGGSHDSSRTNFAGKVEAESALSEISKDEDGSSVVKPTLSANQLAAKALQLRMKGRHEEADKLLKEAEIIKVKQVPEDKLIGQRNEETRSRFIRQGISMQRREDNSDAHLGQWIMKNKQYSVAKQADDEYDFDDAPSRKSRKKGGNEHKLADKSIFPKRFVTQQERCQFCFENPHRPRHLVISIANFTYLMLPPRESVVPGHCYILPLQHESATRTIDDNVWGEIRNFKKCLIMMFAKDDKDLVFLETVMNLAQQRRHCLIECIPLPRDVAKEAPLYFKKAIDEAEDEWSQHNAKRLIDTREKGLRSSIPKGFPYFHVEFGLDRGFVHVIDDEKNFKKSLGLDVIRGMLRLPAEDMHRRGRHKSVEVQQQAVASFARDWDAFDWTKQLA